MKKWLVLSVFMAALPLTMMAQDDDLYFNPKQEAKKAAEERVQKAKLLAAQRARQDSIYALYCREATEMWMNTTGAVNC